MPHYFDAAPAAPSRPGRVRLALPDLDLELATDSGVFSPRGIDPGTQELLRAPGPPALAGDVLDLGCGYGPIACALARRHPSATVWALDVNDRARRLTRLNAESLGVAERVRVVAPEDVPPELRFSALWSNPPIRIGKAALQDLLAGWLDRLAPGGAARLVVNRHLGADSLAAWLAGQGWPVTRLSSRKGYRILGVGPR
jgi:16S rRNA (guanine1207-N2)-methyltransferase